MSSNKETNKYTNADNQKEKDTYTKNSSNKNSSDSKDKNSQNSKNCRDSQDCD